jgi:EAL domain-containing protein (putative c-di-GMP-specific phosphodiesterase class I)
MRDAPAILSAAIMSALPTLAESSVALLIQGIHDVADGDQLLYQECLACLVEPDGKIHRAAEFIPHLEAINALPELDRQIIDLALDELDRDPCAVLGCNLSAGSLSSPVAWLPIYRQIAARPELASRLVLEVTETLPIHSVEMAGHFLAQARRLGCRIAIDDFGVGFATAGRLFAMEADIVKVDALFVRDIRGALNGHGSLYHMVGLAACMAPVVVVEGIENAAHFAAAQMAGATHVQGYHFSWPSPLRPLLGLQLSPGDRQKADVRA